MSTPIRKIPSDQLKPGTILVGCIKCGEIGQSKINSQPFICRKCKESTCKCGNKMKIIECKNGFIWSCDRCTRLRYVKEKDS